MYVCMCLCVRVCVYVCVCVCVCVCVINSVIVCAMQYITFCLTSVMEYPVILQSYNPTLQYTTYHLTLPTQNFLFRLRCLIPPVMGCCRFDGIRTSCGSLDKRKLAAVEKEKVDARKKWANKWIVDLKTWKKL